MQTIEVEQLQEGQSYTGDLFIDSSFVLLPESATVTKELIAVLREWNFKTVLCDGSLSLGGDIGLDSAPEEEKEPVPEKIGNSVKKALEDTKTLNLGNSDKKRMEVVTNVFNEYMNYIEQVYTHYATHKEINQEDLSENVKELCVFIKDNERFVLRVNPTNENCNKNFLIVHSMRSTVLAIAIALHLRLPLSKMIELGVASILHEIGMLRLPPQLYMSNKKLSQAERGQISKHTVYGLSIIKDLNFPLSVQLGVFEHHEKENGSGYPRGLTGDKISKNAKIISVACSYEAISSSRQYKEERSTFDAMVELLQNKNKAYDEEVIRALLRAVSLYPIGTYVYLSNRKVAEVIDANPDNPQYPVVQILTEREKDGSLKVCKTAAGELSIIRILTKKEKEDILNFLENREKKIAAQGAGNSVNVQSQSPAASINPASQTPVTPSTEAAPKQNADGTEDVDISFFE